MAWSTIRRATDEDNERLEAAARRFIARHETDLPYVIMDGPNDDVVNELDNQLYQLITDYHHPLHGRALQLRRLWRKVVARTLGAPGAEGIAYGHVGFHVD